MKNCNKIKSTCVGSRVQAECTDYEGAVNINSSLDSDDCLSISETTEDIYTQLEEINLSALGEECLSYVEVEGKLIVKNVLLKFEEKICELLAEVETLKNDPLCNKKIDSCIDVTGMVDACDQPVETWGQWAQLITNKYLEL